MIRGLSKSILFASLISLSALAGTHEHCAIDALELPDHEATLPAEEFHEWVHARWYGEKYLDRTLPEESMKNYVEAMSTEDKDKTQLIFIGDSIAAAWRYEDSIGAFDKHFGQYNPQNFAIGADTTHGVLRRIREGNLDGFSPEVVVILIGVNNIAWGPQHTVEQTADGILKVVQAIHRKTPESKILLMGLLPRGDDEREGSFRWQKGIDVNAILETSIDNEHLFYLNIAEQLIEADGTVKDNVFEDGVHLSSTGLDVWAEALKPSLEKLIDINETSKPNIVFVLTDQWRAQATGYSGDPNLIGKTPNLDQIANTGINFRNAVSTTPVCTPYRAALLTGQYPTTTGMIFNDLHLPEDAYTMAEMFKESGYTTAYIGKWHLDGMIRDQFTPPERRQGFEYWKALEVSHEYNELVYYEGDNPEKKQWPGYGPYAETDDAISYIEQHADGDEPFLLVLAVGAPHFPHNSAPEEMQALFRPEDIVLRGNVADEFKDSARTEAAGYYAHIAAMDTAIGKLHAAIENAGIADDTIFVFTSDHGEMMGSQGWWPKQKQVAWAESVKVPFLLQYPARFGNNKIVVDVPINTPDILPTLLAMADLPIATSIEGEDMAYAIGNNDAAEDKAALVMNVSPFAGDFDEYRGIYTSRYTYVETLDGPSMLFDMDSDPLQLNNLVDNPEHVELQENLESSLQQELAKVGDNFMPRQYYIDKWNYRLNEAGYIPYGFLEDYESAGPGENSFQGPSLNRK